MPDTSISEIMYTMMSLVFLLLGVVLLVSVLMATINPYDQIAFANAEKLKAAMNTACITGQTSISLDLPQNTPSFTGLFTVMPIWIIQTGGDPNYVMYYESYPPGDAVGWEVYHAMQNRLVVPLPDGYEDKNSEDVAAYADQVRSQWSATRENEILDGIVISNIVLNENASTFYFGESLESPTTDVGPPGILNSLYGLGNWRNVDNRGNIAGGNNEFRFQNYRTLNSFEKASIKYMPCGENSLCMKTRTGVYRFPLDQCGDIKNVQMVYDARDRSTIYAGAGIVGGVAIGCAFTGGALCAGITTTVSGGLSWLRYGISLLWKFTRTLTIGGVTASAYWAGEQVFGAFLSYKVQDFNIASPCNIKEMTITKADCNNAIPLDWAVDQKACTNAIRSPVYEYNRNGKLNEVGDHYTCVEKPDNNINEPPSDTYSPNDQCLQILVTEKAGGFCWTPDPYRPTIASDTQLLARTLGFTPVHENLAFLSSSNVNAFVLKYHPLGDLESWLNFFERRVSWGWPS